MISRLECALEHTSILSLRKALGEEASLHLVGGLVRGVLLGLPVTDIDLATKLKPQEVMGRLQEAGIKVVDTGIEHGTVTAVLGEEFDLFRHIEITTFRKPSARDSSKFSETIEEDLSGRDFTINAIAYDIAQKKLVDPFNGEKDLKNSYLKAVGTAKERFAEDPLRVMRLMRFGPGENRKVDTETKNEAALHSKLLINVSVERIRDELQRILLSQNPREAFRMMIEIGILEVILPEAMPSVGFEQNVFHHEDVFEHTLSVVENAPKERLARLAALFHDLGKPHTLTIGEQDRRHFYLHENKSEELTKTAMSRLRFSVDDTRAVANVVKLHMRPIDCGPSGVRRIIRDTGDNFELWRTLKIADFPPSEERTVFENKLKNFDSMVQEEKERVKGSVYGKLAVNGDDLIEMGLKPGVALGECLRNLEELVIENPDLNDRETLLMRAKEIIGARLAQQKSTR